MSASYYADTKKNNCDRDKNSDKYHTDIDSRATIRNSCVVIKFIYILYLTHFFAAWILIQSAYSRRSFSIPVRASVYWTYTHTLTHERIFYIGDVNVCVYMCMKCSFFRSSYFDGHILSLSNIVLTRWKAVNTGVHIIYILYQNVQEREQDNTPVMNIKNWSSKFIIK